MVPSASERTESWLDWTLRTGAALCFVGHGAFGVLQKSAWLDDFALVRIGAQDALGWMPLVGAWDILMGVLVLTYPRPAVAVWMTAWALWTAALRPLAGEPVWEALERAGNFGVPLAMLLRMTPFAGWRRAFAPATFPPLTDTSCRRIERVLVATVVMLLVGHGVLSIAGKAEFAHNLASMLGEGGAAAALPVMGWIELALALAVVVFRRSAWLLIAVAGWKIATELLWATGGAPWWEFVERGGSYAAPLALAILIRMNADSETGSKE